MPNYDIVPTELIVKAMQDSGFRNAAYALAELIDNAVQAGANKVELICIESESVLGAQRRGRLSQIAVLDNGSGMDATDLRRALQFGNGSHLNDRKGIGRFGMGLPNSSMSQGGRVEVWSWQDGIENAIFSYLDVQEIASRDLRVVPEPVKKDIPSIWNKAGESFSESGTLVVWPRPDRITWKTSRALIFNTEEIVGRIYRRYLNERRAFIRLAAYRDTELDNPLIDKKAVPTDPLYLMERSSCPSPLRDTPMFEPWGEPQIIRVSHKGEEYEIKIKCSMAKKEPREGHNPGGEAYGKHARRNSGVSIMRGDRELELESKWLPTYDPVYRWMGIEVEFPPELDEVFGVTNTKQSATSLSQFAGTEKGEMPGLYGFTTWQEMKTEWAEDNDLRLPLLDVIDSIESSRTAMHALLRAQTKGQRATRNIDRNSAESTGTDATRKRQAEGKEGTSDGQEKLTKKDREQNIVAGLVDEGVDEEQAKELAQITAVNSLKYVFGHAPSTGSAFFNVKPAGGAMLITLNTTHPAYENLVGVLEDSADEEGVGSLKARHKKALNGLKLLLEAWARFEDEQPDGKPKTDVQDAREDWGRVARGFMTES